jgi:hypothetical protein
VNFPPLPDDWPTQRDTLQFLATHVLGQARARHDGLFDLVPSPGGISTPAVGPRRERCRLAGGSMFVERVDGDDVRELTATTTVDIVAGSTLRQLCNRIGFEPDPTFWVGDATPAFRDPDDMIVLDGLATSVLGDWFLLGQRAIDIALASLPDAAASVGRLWPEHFDYGIDLAASPGVRCNLGASAGDGFHAEPYLYVGPWNSDRPGSAHYWNAPFGAVMGFGDLDIADDPLHAAIEFFLTGISLLRAG